MKLRGRPRMAGHQRQLAESGFEQRPWIADLTGEGDRLLSGVDGFRGISSGEQCTTQPAERTATISLVSVAECCQGGPKQVDRFPLRHVGVQFRLLEPDRGFVQIRGSIVGSGDFGGRRKTLLCLFQQDQPRIVGGVLNQGMAEYIPARSLSASWQYDPCLDQSVKQRRQLWRERFGDQTQ